MLLAKTALTLNERRALAAFVAGLQRQHAYDIEDVILYGSAARGGERVDSDVDVMIVLARPLTEGEQTAICALALELSLAYRCELSPLLMSAESMSWHRQGSSLWLNVLHDGIGLWDTDFNNVQRSRRTLKEKGLPVLTPAQQDEIRIHMEYSAQDLEAARSLLDSRMERQAISPLLLCGLPCGQRSIVVERDRTLQA